MTTEFLDASNFVNGPRLWARHIAMAAIGATQKGGVNRQALTDEDNLARALLVRWADELGFACEMDAIGNLFVCKRGANSSENPVLSGSHLDTQPTGGRFDGTYGVLGALEALQSIDEAGITTRLPIEIVVWTNEEGSRFNRALMGSEAFVNPADIDDFLAIADDEGVTVRAALACTRATLPRVGTRSLGGNVSSYVEAHIEQGPVLEAEHKIIGVVTGIQGFRRFTVDVRGEEAHAGTTPRCLRKDAMMAATAIIADLDRLMHDPHDAVRFTVGRLVVSPNSPGVVPGRVTFSIDFRHPEQAVLSTLGDQIPSVCSSNSRQCEVSVREVSSKASVNFASRIPDIIERTARNLRISAMRICSGATHDAHNISAICPVGMIFVPCERGISHNEQENAKPEDLTSGVRVLAATLVSLAM